MDAAEEAHWVAMQAVSAAPGRSLRYGPDADQTLEVFGEAAALSRLVVLVHGGYFRAEVSAASLRGVAGALAHAGALVVVPEYRRAGAGGAHPPALADVSAAIGFALAAAPEWGLHTATEPTVAGHSAGGCLVLAWASHLPPDGPTVRLVPLAPVTDLIREVADGLGDDAVLDYMRVRPEEDLALYLDEDPRSRAALIPPRLHTLIVHGDADGVVDIGFTRTFPAPRRELAGAGHFDLIDPASPFFPAVQDALLG